MPSWDPDIYERHKDHRDRAALDLLLRMTFDVEPEEIWDLGCGAGEQAALLAARHPGAAVHGLDSSPDMLAKARRRAAKVDWVRGDIEAFAPSTPPDLIYANAALQWLDDHGRLFPTLARRLVPGGMLACQMPMSYTSDAYVSLRRIAAEPRWAERFAQVRGVQPVAKPPAYYDWLSPLCDMVDIWTITYLHVLQGDDPVIEWMSGAGLRPYLDALPDPAEREIFLGDYRQALAAYFPPRPDGLTLFPFRRLFIIARRRADRTRPVLLD